MKTSRILIVLGICFILLNMNIVDAKKKQKDDDFEDDDDLDVDAEAGDKADDDDEDDWEEKDPFANLGDEYDGKMLILKSFKELQETLVMGSRMFKVLFVHHPDSTQSVQAAGAIKQAAIELQGLAEFVIVGCHHKGFQVDELPACKDKKVEQLPGIQGSKPPRFAMGMGGQPNQPKDVPYSEQ